MSEPAVSCRSLGKSYGEGESRVQVLSCLDLEVASGEMVAVTGPSGSGKSTLLNLLGILEQPDTGTVLLGGVDPWRVGEQRRAVLRNRHLGFVFQFHHLLGEFTLLENVAMPLLIGGADRRRAFSEASGLLGEVGLSGLLGRFPSTVSGGERQRAAVARALATSPVVVLADEPTGNLDPENGAVLRDLMRRLSRDRGQAFVIATHSRELAASADRALDLRSGRLHPAPPVA
jgi:lipoprotein-releasing system ATP-binding protein